MSEKSDMEVSEMSPDALMDYLQANKRMSTKRAESGRS